MELEVDINASANEVFDEIIASVLDDIKRSTGKKVALEKLCENYSYSKSMVNYMGKSVDVTVIINNLIYPEKYSATIINQKGSNTIEYNLCENDNGVKLKYKESYDSKSIFQKLNYKLVSLFFTRGNKKIMEKRFHCLEQGIIAKRDKNKM